MAETLLPVRSPGPVIHPWVAAPADILPDNRKDAYLIRAIELLLPTHLLTLDDGLLGLGGHGGARIMTPKAMLDLLETIPRI